MNVMMRKKRKRNKAMIQFQYEVNALKQKQPFILTWDNQHKIIYTSLTNLPYVKGSEPVYTDSLFNLDIISEINQHFLHYEKPYIHHNLKLFNQCNISFFVRIDKVPIEQSYIYNCYISVTPAIENTSGELHKMHGQVLIGQVASGYIHEIRNPLTSLKGFIQLLQAGINQKEEYYDVMISEIDKIQHITEQLLQIAKPTDYKKQTENVQEMISDVLILFQANSKMRDISFNVGYDETLHINCNRTQMKQVLINIIKNAIEAMQYKGMIKISTHLYQDRVKIVISDEGPGIDTKVIDQLGNAFITTKENGTGLGLMISKEMIEQNNGDLSIRSEDNKGSTFTLSFPSEIKI